MAGGVSDWRYDGEPEALQVALLATMLESQGVPVAADCFDDEGVCATTAPDGSEWRLSVSEHRRGYSAAVTQAVDGNSPRDAVNVVFGAMERLEPAAAQALQTTANRRADVARERWAARCNAVERALEVDPAGDGTESGGGGTPEAAGAPAPTNGSQRIVAIGDVHGDLPSALEALQLAGAVDAEGAWIGGELIVVQVGDQTDRGDDEREIIDWFERLQEQAAAAGGAFHVLLGNPEVMNVQLDLRYVTEGGFEDFVDIPYDAADPLYRSVPPARRGRVAAFRPGGPYANLLADHPIVLQIGDTVFVHGGLEPEFAALGVDAINSSVAAWMRGEAPEPAAVQGEDSPIWSRDYSLDATSDDCTALSASLATLGATRMVVGHTVQEQVSQACNGQVWRVDVGLSDYYAGATQVLEIIGDQVTPLHMPAAP